MNGINIVKKQNENDCPDCAEKFNQEDAGKYRDSLATFSSQIMVLREEDLTKEREDQLARIESDLILIGCGLELAKLFPENKALEPLATLACRYLGWSLHDCIKLCKERVAVISIILAQYGLEYGRK